MKKQTHLHGGFIVLLLILLMGINSNAQKLYIKPGLGYSFGIQPYYYNVSNYFQDANNDTVTEQYTYNSQKLNLGKGFQFELGIGAFLGKHISVEIDGFYHSSDRQSIEYTEYWIVYEIYDVDISYEHVFQAKSYGFKPNLVVWGSGEKFKPYMKFGGVFGFTKLAEEQEIKIFNTIPHYYPTEDYFSVKEYDRQLSLGVTAAAGLEMIFSDVFSIFAECSYIGMNYVPLEAEITTFEYRGRDQLSSLTASERYYEFVDEIGANDNQNENLPTKELTTSYGLNNIRMLAGFRINLIK